MLLREVHIHCASLRTMYAFYRKQMGMQCGLTTERLTVIAGSTKLIFTPKKNFHGGYHYAFSIPEGALSGALAFLKKNTSMFYSYDDDSYIADFPKWKARSLFFSDADGNVVELIARKGDGEYTDENFDVAAIISLSEIGLGCQSPRHLAMQLRAQAGLEEYDKGRDYFKAVGDRYGLFILSSPVRNWYPSTLPTKLLETRVLFENLGKFYDLQHTPDRTHISTVYM